MTFEDWWEQHGSLLSATLELDERRTVILRQALRLTFQAGEAVGRISMCAVPQTVAVIPPVKTEDMNDPVICPICKGSGKHANKEGFNRICETCFGKGLIAKYGRRCPDCNGTGDETSDGQGKCGTCKGIGYVYV